MFSHFRNLLSIVFYFFLISNASADNQPDIEQLQSIDMQITTHLGDSQSFVEGDQISFLLSLDKAAYIYLFYQDANNNVIQIVPNYKQQSNFYQPGFFIPIPSKEAEFTFTAQSPFGEEKLWVFATDKPSAEFTSPALDKQLKQITFSIENIKLKIKSEAAILYGESVLTLFVTELK